MEEHQILTASMPSNQQYALESYTEPKAMTDAVAPKKQRSKSDHFGVARKDFKVWRCNCATLQYVSGKLKINQVS